MRSLAYPKDFKVDAIFPLNDNNKRYSLRISRRNTNVKGSATVIMMNPSKATEICSDQTVNRVLKFFRTYKDKKISEIIILNLFPHYLTNSKELATHIKNNKSSDLADNLNGFNKYIEGSDLVVLAWGDVPEGFSAKLHNQYVNKVIDIINTANKQDNLYVFKTNRFGEENIITKKGRPRHPNRNTLNDLQKVNSHFLYRDLLKLKF